MIKAQNSEYEAAMTMTQKFADELIFQNKDELSKDEIDQLEANLLILKDEFKGSILEHDKKTKAFAFLSIYKIMIEDYIISREEYEDWTNKFESRHMLDKLELQKYVNSLTNN